MSPRVKFDRYMIVAGSARHAKFRRLTTAERHAFFLGVLSLAAQAPIRGCLLVGDLQADENDVAGEADVTVREARSAMEKLRAVGVIYRDEDLGCERVHDFEEWNPPPKRDATNADRQRRYKDRLRASGNAVTNGTVTAVTSPSLTASNGGEVEVEEKTPVTPPGADVNGGRVFTFRKRPVSADQRTLAEAILGDFNQQARTGYGAYTGDGRPSEDLKRILGAIADATPPLTLAEAARITKWRLTHPFWQGKPHTGVVFGPNVFPANRESAKAPGGGALTSVEIGEAIKRSTPTPPAA